jgi:hypothetical protein
LVLLLLFSNTPFSYCPVLKDRLQEHAPDEIKRDAEFMILACKNDGTVGELIEDRQGGLWHDTAFVDGAVAAQPRVLLHVPPELQRQPRFKDLYMQNLKRMWDTYASNTTESWGCVMEMSAVLQEFPEVAVEFVRCGFNLDLNELSAATLASYTTNRDLVLEVTRSCGNVQWRQDFYDALKRENSPLLGDAEFLAEAVKNDGSILHFVDNEVATTGDKLLTGMASNPKTDTTTRLALRFPEQAQQFQEQLCNHNVFNYILKDELYTRGLPMLALDKISECMVKPEYVDCLRRVHENLMREKGKPPSPPMITRGACLMKLKQVAEQVSVCYGKTVRIQITSEDRSVAPVKIQIMSDDDSVAPSVSDKAHPTNKSRTSKRKRGPPTSSMGRRKSRLAEQRCTQNSI